MNSVEDQIRAATRTEAETLREVRPLRLPPAYGAVPGSGAPGAPGRRTWLAPVTAAAAVLAIALSLVIVREFAVGRAAPPAGHVGATGAAPRYYVALTAPPTGWYAYAPLGGSSAPSGGTDEQRLVIGETLTGKRLATMAPPSGSRFVDVTGAADDRTFVVSTMLVTPNSHPPLAVTWYLLRLAPGTKPGYLVLHRLAIPDMRSWGVRSIALSGSGRELAVMLVPAVARAGVPSRVLRIYSLATGKLLHGWSTNDTADFRIPPVSPDRSLTWTNGDRAVVFPTFGITPARHSAKVAMREAERVLNVASGGTDLIADSRVIWSQRSTEPAPDGYCQWGLDPLVTADGNTVICGTSQAAMGKNRPVTLTWLAYSTSAPTVPRVLFTFTVHASGLGVFLHEVPWSDASGSTQIVAYSLSLSAGMHYDVVSHGKLRPLPSVPASASGPSIVAF